jgi:NAD(P)-dependent dehydrogenase (short-subunit alcohol dehydrogenase family)
MPLALQRRRRLRSSSVLVTGAGGGIGLGIAQAFHQAGARVALGDLHESGLAHAAERLGSSERVFTHPVDVHDDRSVADFVQATERAIGPVTIGVANAGV